MVELTRIWRGSLMASGEGTPDSTDPLMKAAPAKQEVLTRSTVDALMNVRPEYLVDANPHAEVIRIRAMLL
jgi:hypothetical protein